MSTYYVYKIAYYIEPLFADSMADAQNNANKGIGL